MMDEINITIFELRADGKEIGHPVSLPTYLIPSIGDELYIAKSSPVQAFRITGKRIVILEDGKHHIALKAVCLNDSL